MMAKKPCFIVVNRRDFTMRLHFPTSGLRHFDVAQYRIATGVVGRATKAGEYEVRNKSATPDWNPPKWANLGTEVLPFSSPHNPFAGGFISFEDDDPDNDNEGMGFHGTKFDPQVGTRASHGCVRMRTPDFKEIYDKVVVGSVVAII